MTIYERTLASLHVFAICYLFSVVDLVAANDCPTGLYMSLINDGCVECPKKPSGCTTRLNKDNLKNCLACFPKFSTAPVTKPTMKLMEATTIMPKVKETIATMKPMTRWPATEKTVAPPAKLGSSKNNQKSTFVISVTVPVVLLNLVLAAAVGRYMYKRRRQRSSRHDNIENNLANENSHQLIPKRESQRACTSGKPLEPETCPPSKDTTEL